MPDYRPAYVEDENPLAEDGDRETRHSASGAVSGSKRPDKASRQDKSSRPKAPSDSGVSGLSQASRGSGSSDGRNKPTKSARGPPESASDRQKRHMSISDRDRAREHKREPRRASPEKRSGRHEARVDRHDMSYDSRRDASYSNGHESAQARKPARPSPLDIPLKTDYSPFTQSSQYPPQSPGAYQYPYPQVTGGYAPPVETRPRGLPYTSRPPSVDLYAHATSLPTTAPGYYPRTSQGYATTEPAYDPRTGSFAPGYPTAGPVYTHTAGSQPQGSPTRPSLMQRPMLPRYSTERLPEYSARSYDPTAPRLPTYNLQQHKLENEVDDFDFSTRPKQGTYKSSMKGMPGAFQSSDSSDSDPEKPPYIRGHSDGNLMLPPPPPRPRPNLKHAATGPAIPTSRGSVSAWPVVHQPTYARTQEIYADLSADRAMVTRDRSDSRQSEKSYRSGNTYRSDPAEYEYGRRIELDRHPSARRLSVNSQGKYKQNALESERYQNDINGASGPLDLSKEWLMKEQRRSLTSGRTSSHISSGSHHSHRSRNSISSRVSANGRTSLDVNGTIIDIPAGYRASVKTDEDNGNLRVILGGAREREYHGEESGRSSAQASSGSRSRRSRAESEASRGRRHSVRPDHHRRSEHSGD